MLRTKVSHGRGSIEDAALWSRIWREQLGLGSEEEFWKALRTKKPVNRESPTPAPPSGPSKPGWLLNSLIFVAGLPEQEVERVSVEESTRIPCTWACRPWRGDPESTGTNPVEITGDGAVRTGGCPAEEWLSEPRSTVSGRLAWGKTILVRLREVSSDPDDFAELQGSSELLDELVAAPGLSDLGARAHRLAESPEGELIDDEASIRRLLGL